MQRVVDGFGIVVEDSCRGLRSTVLETLLMWTHRLAYLTHSPTRKLVADVNYDSSDYSPKLKKGGTRTAEIE